MSVSSALPYWGVHLWARPSGQILPLGSVGPWLLKICLGVADAALVIAAFQLAHWLRFVVPAEEALALGLEQYVYVGVVVAAVTVLQCIGHRLYDLHSPVAWMTRQYLLVSSVSIALALAAAAAALQGDQRFSRMWIATGWGLAVCLLSAWHTAIALTLGRLRHVVVPPRRVAILGGSAAAVEIARELTAAGALVGFVDDAQEGIAAGDAARAELSRLGSVDDLERIVRDHRVDEIIIAFPPDRRAFLGPVLARGFDRHVRVTLLPDLPHVPHAGALLPERAEIARIGGRTCIGFAPVAKVGWTKRAMDLALACVALVMLSGGLAIIALAIKLDSPGPVLYRQRRVGKDGRHFWMYKFRSMRRDADRMVDSLRAMNEASGPLFKMRRDPRVTRVGAILRRLSLDELPQLINVLRGEMSLVGPRPPVPDEVEQYEDWQHGRLRALPGMTGLWQVSGRSELSFVEMVRLDLQYVRNWTLALDVQILWRTVPAVLTRRGAY